jgi:REP element-mobilizing transposase RayT
MSQIPRPGFFARYPTAVRCSTASGWLPELEKDMTVIAYHLVWTVYGTWLPNDPRGSGSHFIASELLEELGDIHYGRRKVQPAPKMVREFYDRAEERLQFPVIRFNSTQIGDVATAIGECIAESAYTCYACAILPDHVHLVIRKHRDRAEQMIETLQRSSRLRLSTGSAIPDGHPLWTLGGWRGFLDSPERVRTVIRYVENNPPRAGLPRQNWAFVTRYDGWDFSKRSP